MGRTPAVGIEWEQRCVELTLYDGLEMIDNWHTPEKPHDSFLLGHLLPLQKLVELRRPEKKQRRWCKRRKHADLRDKDCTHRKPMQKIAGRDCTEQRCRRGLPNLSLALLITVAYPLLSVAQQDIDPFLQGQWRFRLD